jgi:hypothetical protein
MKSIGRWQGTVSCLGIRKSSLIDGETKERICLPPACSFSRLISCLVCSGTRRRDCCKAKNMTIAERTAKVRLKIVFTMA